MSTGEAEGPAETAAQQERPKKLVGVPLIFMFQPTEFIVVKKDEIAAWEEMMRKSVGLERFADFKATRATHGFETTSICPGAGADDCDWHDEDFPTTVTGSV